ncbi:YggT family protein [Thalassotalea mangrovi]|uniref:YggT family protein n=1 Tax=Thalassotalea mangrovi TaxID=2572245 RepID=A0A4V5NUM2_9GAMM|nr:YggT family protein [Thalassotalea mangrovi]TKB47121.1 YggT family protein [Thalassotalea mangrovi]
MEAVNFLLNFLFDTYIMILLLRVWLQAARADFYNPFSQFVVKATAPVVNPFRRLIPGFGGVDVATLVVALLVGIGKFVVLSLLNGAPIDVLSFVLIGALFTIKQAGFLVFWVMILMALMSWVVQHGNPIQLVFHQLTQPILNPIRRVLPDLGGLDLSVLIALVALNFLNLFIAGLLPIWRIL